WVPKVKLNPNAAMNKRVRIGTNSRLCALGRIIFFRCVVRGRRRLCRVFGILGVLLALASQSPRRRIARGKTIRQGFIDQLFQEFFIHGSVPIVSPSQLKFRAPNWMRQSLRFFTATSPSRTPPFAK